MPVDHEFGGISTDLKLSMVEAYLAAFTRALRSKFAELWYIDAFAGTGVRTIKQEARPSDLAGGSTEARVEQRRGSAQIALDVTPKFDHLVFIDMKRKHFRALQDLAAAPGFSDRSIQVERGDANTKILAAIQGKRWAHRRAVMFLDPYGMHVNWSTLVAVSATQAIDVWYLVSLEGLYRQAPLDRAKLTDHKRAAITRLLGTSDWEDVWYAPKTAPGGLLALMEDNSVVSHPTGYPKRTADLKDIEQFVHDRLRTIFPKVLPPLRLKNKAGVPAFLLFFAVSNPEPKAWGLASNIASHILKAGSSSQN